MQYHLYSGFELRIVYKKFKSLILNLYIFGEVTPQFVRYRFVRLGSGFRVRVRVSGPNGSERNEVNPCSPEGFSQTYFPKGGCCNPAPSGLSIPKVI